MGRGIIKLTNDEPVEDDEPDAWYLEWSTISDAPITYGMTLEEMEAHQREQYGEHGMKDWPARLERLEGKGTSFLCYGSAASAISLNRAGPGESEITKREIVQRYCRTNEGSETFTERRLRERIAELEERLEKCTPAAPTRHRDSDDG